MLALSMGEFSHSIDASATCGKVVLMTGCNVALAMAAMGLIN